MSKDPHSFSRPNEAIVRHVALDLTVDFEKRKLSGKARLQIENLKKGHELYLDVDDLVIDRVTLGQPEVETGFRLHDKRKHLGQPFAVDILPETSVVTVYYSTKPTAAALQWLQPGQTAARKLPFLFTQSQAALARTWLPSQDTPAVRTTYEARIKTRPDVMAVMSAENSIKKTG